MDPSESETNTDVAQAVVYQSTNLLENGKHSYEEAIFDWCVHFLKLLNVLTFKGVTQDRAGK